MFWKRKDRDERRSGEDRRGKKSAFGELSTFGKVLRILWWASIVLPLGTFLWRYFIRHMFMITGAAVIVVTAGYFSFEFVINYVDEHAWIDFDKRLGTDKEAIERLHDPAYFAEQSEIVSESDQSIACISSPERRVLIDDPADLPNPVWMAMVASEDKNFFKHGGVDKIAIMRAAAQQLLGMSTSGASTISMQLAKDARGGTGHRSSVKEKIGDMIEALRIEREFSKWEILVKYANTPYYGRGQYGFAAASQAYFGKAPKDLELHQIAFLVSLINKPALPDRSFAKDKSAKTSQEVRDANWQAVVRGTRRVIEQMERDKFIDDEQATKALIAVDNRLRDEVQKTWNRCGANDYYTERVRQTVMEQGFRVDKGGLTVPVPEDPALQARLTEAVSGPEGAMALYLKRHPNDTDNDELRACAYAVTFDGDVLAWVGNDDFKKHKFDACALGWRSPGSTIKPFTYGNLIDKLTNEFEADDPKATIDEIVAGVTHRCTVLDAPVAVGLGRGRGVKWIENFHSNSEPLFRGNISCALALGESRNAAAMRVGQMGGIKNMIDLIYRLGMPKDAVHFQQPYPTTAIGASDVVPLGMAGAATFVNGGFKVTPRFFSDICKDGLSQIYKDENGNAKSCDPKGEERAPPERVYGPAQAAAMAELLQAPADVSVVDRGKLHYTGTVHGLREGIIPGVDPLSSEIWQMKPDERKRRMIAFPADEAGCLAGKTGTATNADGRTSDVWLLLFIPGPPDQPQKGIMLVFWMGKDSKDHPLGERGSHGGSIKAETGARNWLPAAAPVLEFLQKDRGYLKAGNCFKPIYHDEALEHFDALRYTAPTQQIIPDPNGETFIDPSDPNTDPRTIEGLPQPPQADPGQPNGDPEQGGNSAEHND